MYVHFSSFIEINVHVRNVFFFKRRGIPSLYQCGIATGENNNCYQNQDTGTLEVLEIDLLWSTLERNDEKQLQSVLWSYSFGFTECILDTGKYNGKATHHIHL